MSLRPSRRIFARKKRLSAASVALRLGALLAVGLTATRVAEKWPHAAAMSQTDLPAVSDAAPLRAQDPVMRLAAASPQRSDVDEPAHDGARRAPHTQP